MNFAQRGGMGWLVGYWRLLVTFAASEGSLEGGVLADHVVVDVFDQLGVVFGEVGGGGCVVVLGLLGVGVGVGVGGEHVVS